MVQPTTKRLLTEAKAGEHAANPATPLGAALSGSFARASSARFGNRMVNLGDSITIAGETVTGSTPQYNESYGHIAAQLSQGALHRVYNAGIGGNTSAQMLARFDTDVAAYSPNIVTIMSGANDSNQGLTLDQFKTNIKAIVAKCLGIGAVPVLITCTPVNYASGTSQELVMRSYNAWLKAYGDRNNLLVVDFYPIAADPAQRFTWKTGLVNGDGIHPNTSGHRLLGTALWAALQSRVTPASQWLTQDTNDPNNILANGLFIGDANADGIADGWASIATPSAGTFARSIVTDSSVAGTKMQRLSVTGATGANTIEQYIQLSGGKAAVGDVVRFAGIITTSGGTRAQAFVNFAGGKYVTWFTDDTLTRARFEMEFTIPTGSTLLQTQLSVIGGTGSADFGQVTLYNLTRQSLITI